MMQQSGCGLPFLIWCENRGFQVQKCNNSFLGVQVSLCFGAKIEVNERHKRVDELGSPLIFIEGSVFAHDRWKNLGDVIVKAKRMVQRSWAKLKNKQAHKTWENFRCFCTWVFMPPWETGKNKERAHGALTNWLSSEWAIKRGSGWGPEGPQWATGITSAIEAQVYFGLKAILGAVDILGRGSLDSHPSRDC